MRMQPKLTRKLRQMQLRERRSVKSKLPGALKRNSKRESRMTTTSRMRFKSSLTKFRMKYRTRLLRTLMKKSAKS